MEKTVSQRLIEMAEVLTVKAEEIRNKTQGVEANVSTTANKRFSKQSQK